MFEFDAAKLILIGIVALIVIGPKELPRLMRQVGQALAKLRRLGAEFQAQFMEAMREADAEEAKAGLSSLAESAKLDLGVDPLALAKAEITSALQAPVGAGEVTREMVKNAPAPGPGESIAPRAAPEVPQA